MAKFYITTAIDYTSGKPHMGHCYEKICADVLARWHRQRGEDVFFLTGTDEHGQKIQLAAKKENLKPKEYVDQIVIHFKELCKKYNVSYNRFIRTTDKDHEEFVKDYLQRVFDKGDIYLGKYEGWYCIDCEQYYTERDLKDKKCPVHGKKCEWFEEESYFFKMSKYQKEVIQYMKKNNYTFPDYRNKFLLGRINEGVRDLSISRTNFNWGIKIPFNTEHTNFVWFDALLNYLSAVQNNLKHYWPADIHLIGHDIAWHHSIVWLSMLKSLNYPLPKNLVVHGFINDEKGMKMSKSLGNVIDPLEIIKTYPADTIRYFLIREIPFGQDGNFSIKAMIDRHNKELMNDLGNLLSRTQTLINKNFNNKIKVAKKNELLKNLDFKKIDRLMNDLQPHMALSEIWKFINECNKYVNDNKPWEIKDEERLKKVLYNLTEALRVIAILIQPFMPTTAENLSKQLGMKEVGTFKDIKFGILGEQELGKKEYLFTKMEEVKMDSKEEPLEKGNQIKFKDWKNMDLRIGKILEVKDHPEADKLYVMKVACPEDRQIVAGLKQYYKPEELIGKSVVVFTNLQPATIRGVESNGMILAAESKDKVSLITPDKEIQEGSKIL